MYAQYAKENHEEMHGRKWETFNEARVTFHQWEHVFAAGQRTSLLLVLLECLVHVREDFGTGLADDRRMGSSVGKFTCVIPEF